MYTFNLIRLNNLFRKPINKNNLFKMFTINLVIGMLAEVYKYLLIKYNNRFIIFLK